MFSVVATRLVSAPRLGRQVRGNRELRRSRRPRRRRGRARPTTGCFFLVTGMATVMRPCGSASSLLARCRDGVRRACDLLLPQFLLATASAPAPRALGDRRRRRAVLVRGLLSCPPGGRGAARSPRSSLSRRAMGPGAARGLLGGLGWAKPFSSDVSTARQRVYGARFGNAGRVYTPQMVVDGRTDRRQRRARRARATRTCESGRERRQAHGRAVTAMPAAVAGAPRRDAQLALTERTRSPT